MRSHRETLRYGVGVSRIIPGEMGPGQTNRMHWRRLGALIQRWIPTQRILHPFPSVRFDVTDPREEPYVEKPDVRIWAGGVG